VSVFGSGRTMPLWGRLSGAKPGDERTIKLNTFDFSHEASRASALEGAALTLATDE
jgi:hypothetical protein